jgi:DNA helicase-2/ATP-dependent DNA helicase PcrA
MITPTMKQLEIRDTKSLGLLVIAPAGCGKTEALALRVHGLIRNDIVTLPRKVLVVTFSNRARDNIQDRLRIYLHPDELRDRVTVSNFHGLSARIFRAHAGVIGLDPSMSLPESDWVGEECRRLGLDYPAQRQVESQLRVAKQEPHDDETVETLLDGTALQIERKRKAEMRLTYDDLPRLAELILAHEIVADLYRAHFGATVVDEFQDLTPQQLRLVRAIGECRTTYAGDMAQGIYRFAGAQPQIIDKAVRSECSHVVALNESHRSSPAILEAVNSLSTLTGGTLLVAADPSSWPSGGLAGCVTHADVYDEAQYVLRFVEMVLAHAPNQRVGVIARATSRRRFVDEAFSKSNIVHHRWDDGVLDTDTARLVKAMLSTFDQGSYATAADKIEFLRSASKFDDIVEPHVREGLVGAITWCYDSLCEGASPAEIRSRIRIGDSSTLLTVAGAHLLTGHAGKGQQFDWVFVLGMEDGSIPNFNATSEEELAEEARVLAVMISRARHGVILSSAISVPTLKGQLRSQDPSRFFSKLNSSALKNDAGIDEWVDHVDWLAVAER